MSKEKQLKEFEFTLSEPVNIHKGGQNIQVNKILLKSPNSKQQLKRILIKEAIIKAFAANERANISAENKSKNNVEISKEEEVEAVIGLLYAYLHCEKINDVLEAFKYLLKDGCGIFEDKATVTDYYLEQMDDDIEAMLGEYIVNFILQSRTKQQKKN